MTEPGNISVAKNLVGFVTLKPGEQVAIEDLKAFLVENLPRHLVPGTIEIIDSMPLLPNGKMDRRALKEIASDKVPNRSNVDFESELSEEDFGILQQICEMFAEVLNRPVEPTDDFFGLGGHSILAVRLFGRLSADLGIELPIATLFSEPTPLGIFEHSRNTGTQKAELRADVLVTIRKEGSLPPLFLVHGAGGNILKFDKLSRSISPGRQIFGLQARGVDGVSEPHTSIDEMSAEYLSAIEDAAPTGQVHLAGYSGGGIVALEIGRELHRQQRLGGIVMIDTFCPYLLKPKHTDAASRRKHRLNELRKQGPRYLVNWIGDRIEFEIDRFKHKRYQRVAQGDEPIPHEMREYGLLNEFGSAITRHDLKPIEFPVVLIASETNPELHSAWSEWMTGGLSIENVPATHYDILHEPAVNAIAQIIDDCIARNSS